jgi:hypothetical protein
MEVKIGKYAIGTKVWLKRRDSPYPQQVTIKDNVIFRGPMYNGYVVEAYSETYGKNYEIGMVNESSLTYRKPV